jgi:hypothetical protein
MLATVVTREGRVQGAKQGNKCWQDRAWCMETVQEHPCRHVMHWKRSTDSCTKRRAVWRTMQMGRNPIPICIVETATQPRCQSHSSQNAIVYSMGVPAEGCMQHRLCGLVSCIVAPSRIPGELLSMSLEQATCCSHDTLMYSRATAAGGTLRSCHSTVVQRSWLERFRSKPCPTSSNCAFIFACKVLGIGSCLPLLPPMNECQTLSRLRP